MAITINGTGTITGVSVGGLPDGIVDTDMLATDAVSAAKLQSTAVTAGDLPAGSILQVVTQADNTEYRTATGTTPTNFSGLNCSITPSSTNSKILILVSLGGASSGGDSSNLGYCKIRYDHSGITEADVTPIGLNDVNGSSKMHFSIPLEGSSESWKSYVPHYTHLHSPSTTNEVTYKLYFWMEGTAGTVKVNRSERNNNGQDVSCLSSVTLMEVAG